MLSLPGGVRAGDCAGQGLAYQFSCPTRPSTFFAPLKKPSIQRITKHVLKVMIPIPCQGVLETACLHANVWTVGQPVVVFCTFHVEFLANHWPYSNCISTHTSNNTTGYYVSRVQQPMASVEAEHSSRSALMHSYPSLLL